LLLPEKRQLFIQPLNNSFKEHKTMKRIGQHMLIFSFLLLVSLLTRSQDFLMQGWYWGYPKTADKCKCNWADTLALRAASIAKGGFTYVWLPPLSRTSSGSESGGYDPKDLFDLGEFGQGPTGFGSRKDLNRLLNVFKTYNINAVADVVYNHRDGGNMENNPVVQRYVDSGYSTPCGSNPVYTDPSYNPYPSDRFRYILPLGKTTGNDSGDYFIKISSLSQNPAYFNSPYSFYAQTNSVGNRHQSPITQTRPDGGMDCGQPGLLVPLGVTVNAVTANGNCFTDEYRIHLGPADFNPLGDTLYINISNQDYPDGRPRTYSDHRIYAVWNSKAGRNILSQLVLQTNTNYEHLPSAKGAMNYTNFHPDGIGCSVLGKDWDYPYYFSDYAQDNPATFNVLNTWTQWLWKTIGMRGFRMDAVKDFDPKFVGHLLTALYSKDINPGLVVGEYWDAEDQIDAWVKAVRASMTTAADSAIQVRAFDFPLRFALKDACDKYGDDVRYVYNAGIVHHGNGMTGNHVVTFVNNHDLRDSSNLPVQHDPVLAYAYIFTDNSVGMPSAFYPDYFGIRVPYYPQVYLKPVIDSLISIHKKYIFNSSSVDYLNMEGSSFLNSPTNYISAPDGAAKTSTLIYQLSGGTSGKDIIIAINFAGVTLKVDHQINTHGGQLLEGLSFFDILKHSNYPSASLSSNGTIYIELPPRSFSVWVNDDDSGTFADPSSLTYAGQKK
jgi:hypothetical protein